MIVMMMLKVNGCFNTSKSNFETICFAFMVTMDVADFGRSDLCANGLKIGKETTHRLLSRRRRV